jgi:hypothetical protein
VSLSALRVLRSIAYSIRFRRYCWIDAGIVPIAAHLCGDCLLIRRHSSRDIGAIEAFTCIIVCTLTRHEKHCTPGVSLRTLSPASQLFTTLPCSLAQVYTSIFFWVSHHSCPSLAGTLLMETVQQGITVFGCARKVTGSEKSARTGNAKGSTTG